MLKRVLMTTDTVGGVWNYSLDLIKGLGDFSIDVELATMGRELTSYQRDLANQIPNLRIHESTFRLEWMDDPWSDIDSAGLWLKNLERKLKPDLIHFNNFCHANLDFGNRPKLTVVHSDVLSWWRSVYGTEIPKSWKNYKTRVKKGLQASDTVVAPTLTMLESAIHDYGPFSRSLVIPNARSQMQDLNDSFQKKEPFIFVAGRVWDEAKNIQLIEEIAPFVKWPIYIAGQCEYYQSSHSSNVHFLGEQSVEQISNYLARASIYALPAKYEPFGLSVLEAAMNKCALVLGDIPSLNENWNKAAIFINPHRPENAIQEINKLILDSRKRERFAYLAHERSENFNLHQMATSYLHEYYKLLRKKSLMMTSPESEAI